MRDKPAPDSQLPTIADTNQTRTVSMPTKGEDPDRIIKPSVVSED